MAKRRKFLAGLGALASGSAAAVGTGAFSTASMDRGVSISVVDDSKSLIALEPGLDSNIVSTAPMSGDDDRDGPDYLKIDFDPDDEGTGINPASRYQLGISPKTGDYVYDDNYKTAPDEYENKHTFSVTNHDSEAKDITVEFEATNTDSEGGFSLVAIRDNGDVVDYGDSPGGFTGTAISHTAEDVGSGETVYVVFGLSSAKYMNSVDMGGQITVEATSTD